MGSKTLWKANSLPQIFCASVDVCQDCKKALPCLRRWRLGVKSDGVRKIVAAKNAQHACEPWI